MRSSYSHSQPWSFDCRRFRPTRFGYLGEQLFCANDLQLTELQSWFHLKIGYCPKPTGQYIKQVHFRYYSTWSASSSIGVWYSEGVQGTEDKVDGDDNGEGARVGDKGEFSSWGTGAIMSLRHCLTLSISLFLDCAVQKMDGFMYNWELALERNLT